MKLLTFILFVLEETVIATSSLGPVTLLEVKWAKEMGLIQEKVSLQEAARQITASRLVVRRYGWLINEIPRKVLERAKELGIDQDFARDLAGKLLSLRKFTLERFGTQKENYIKWRDRELEREGFRLLLKTSRLSRDPTCEGECNKSSGEGK